ncbi:class I SAM-dependent methyltransferase [Williamsia sp. CHRR-6]|uniref:class I SAM-dependent methyltransferase n=1 Tax=Williamsia sp. CHRR-6 TaxID=2835871 RepID=UPI001BDB3956|nr:methyltransferase domain-containing protein [Williamsia sp. CHRR-6]MBT0566625.1 methyltransferase domain-containing protein [Williamsia sp. CHRR-6]
MQKYTASARFYDLISAEWPVYRRGRAAGMALLDLTVGDTVVDLGCGTGLNFPWLWRQIGPSGRVIGIDRSPDMLAQAARRIARHRPGSADQLIRSDCADVDFAAIDTGEHGPVRAVVATYALSLMPDPHSVLQRVCAQLPDAAVLVVDMAQPVGRGPLGTALTRWVGAPLARAACRAGGADITARPWLHLHTLAPDHRDVEVCGGHIHACVGRSPSS